MRRGLARHLLDRKGACSADFVGCDGRHTCAASLARKVLADQTGKGWGTEMLKMASATTAAAAIAGALILVPGFSPSVNARTAAHKSDRLDLTIRMARCRHMAWPYYDRSCRKDAGRPRRIITTDRI